MSTNRSSLAWIPWALSAGLGLLLLVALAAFIGLLLARIPGRDAGGSQGTDEYPTLTEVHAYGQGDEKVAWIALRGVITHEPDAGLFGLRADPVEGVLRRIRAAAHDDAVVALVMELDSPGGAVTPSDELYDAVCRFRESREDRRVFAFCRGLAASGAYFVACGADWIFAEPTSLVGSIGVILQTLNWRGLSEKIGVTDTTIASGENKDLLNPFQPVDPAQKAMLQRTIDTLYARFFDAVLLARDLPEERLRTLADGRIFAAEEALDAGLIDETAYAPDVRNRVTELMDRGPLRFIRYEEEVSLMDWLARARNPLHIDAWRPSGSPRAMYIWRP